MSTHVSKASGAQRGLRCLNAGHSLLKQLDAGKLLLQVLYRARSKLISRWQSVTEDVTHTTVVCRLGRRVTVSAGFRFRVAALAEERLARLSAKQKARA